MQNRASSERPLHRHRWALGECRRGSDAAPRGPQDQLQVAEFSVTLSHVKWPFSFGQNQSKTGSGDMQS